MRFELSDEQRLLCESIERTVERVSPLERVQRLDNAKAFDDELHAALAELGVLGVGVPEAGGGSGGGPVEEVLALEVLGRRATSMAVFLVVHFMATRLLAEHGTAAQKSRYLAGLCAGRLKAAFAMTEAAGGTDVLASVTTRARWQGDGWILQGSKMWISGARRADVLVVVARTAEHRTRGLTLFLVPRASPGVTVSEVRTVAINSLDTCEIAFEDVRLGRESLLGTADQGFHQVLGTLNSERMNAAAVAVGIARGAEQAALAYARERRAFGKPIGQFQALQHRLVQAGVRLEAAWLLTLRAAADDAAGAPADISASMAKLAASWAATEATQVGMEVMGGAGFDTDLPMQRYFRDARLYVFAPLTNDMVTNYLGERWLGLPRSF